MSARHAACKVGDALYGAKRPGSRWGSSGFDRV